MPRPFPYPISIGTDICQISRIYNILTKGDSAYTRRFLTRLLTDRERTTHSDRIKPLRYYLSRLEHIERLSWQSEDGGRNSQELKSAPIDQREVSAQSSQGSTSGMLRSVEGVYRPKKEALLEEMKHDLQDVAVFMAGRFAAKEAVIKAHKRRRLTFSEIKVVSPQSKDGTTLPPVTTITPRRPDEQDQIVPLSISHDGDYATAVCMAIDTQIPGDDETTMEPAGPPTKAVEPKSLRPPITEEDISKQEARAAKLATRKESVYGLPNTIDPKVISKIIERAAIVHNIPSDTTSQELVDLFKGRCIAVKGYVEKLPGNSVRGLVVFRYTHELKNNVKAAKQGAFVLREKTIRVSLAKQLPSLILRAYARTLKKEPHPLRGFEENEIHALGLSVGVGATAARQVILGLGENGINLGEFWTTDVYSVQKGCANRVEA